MKRWEYLMIHHSATKDGPTVSWGAIRKYHVRTRRWRAIGYHAGVELVGDAYEVLMGRPWWMNGAHCPGMNRKAFGLVLVGNFEDAAPARAQLKAAATFADIVCRLFEIPVEKIVRHDAFRQTSCPGKRFDIEAFRALVATKRAATT